MVSKITTDQKPKKRFVSTLVSGALIAPLLAAALNLLSADSTLAAETKSAQKSALKKTTAKVRAKKSGEAPGFVAGPLYFYSVTHVESSGWIYVIPFCKKLAQEEFKQIKKSCKSTSEAGQRCETDKTVELKEAGGPKTQKFNLDYFVFVSERDCVQDRESYTSGDVVPFH
jgi:hypothetical protein